MLPRFLVGTVLGSFAAPALAQQQPPAGAPPTLQLPPPTAAAAPQPQRTILSVTVQGNQRLEPETVLSYTSLRPGEPYDNERLDTALRDLLATELFADVVRSPAPIPAISSSRCARIR